MNKPTTPNVFTRRIERSRERKNNFPGQRVFLPFARLPCDLSDWRADHYSFQDAWGLSLATRSLLFSLFTLLCLGFMCEVISKHGGQQTHPGYHRPALSHTGSEKAGRLLSNSSSNFRGFGSILSNYHQFQTTSWRPL